MAVARRLSLPTVIDESILVAIEEDEDKLLNVNLQIKMALTELLNCGSVRSDKRYRAWVQLRLMGAERKLKGRVTNPRYAKPNLKGASNPGQESEHMVALYTPLQD
jgi:hypothetical protein